MLVRRNFARTTQPARPVLQTEITSVCVFPDLLDMTAKKVLINRIAMSGLSQLNNENFDLRYNVPRTRSSNREGNCKSWLSIVVTITFVGVAFTNCFCCRILLKHLTECSCLEIT